MTPAADFTPIPPACLIETLRNRDNFLVATHVNPDGDAVGSAVALSMALEKIGKKIVLVDKHPVSPQYFFLPGHERFHTYETFQASGHRVSDFETLVMLDCNTVGRIGLESVEQHPAIEELKGAVAGGMFSIIIDHHQVNNDFGNVKWIDSAAAATGILVYSIIKTMGIPITMDMAENLYTAIVIDTGNFRFDNTTPDVLRIAAELADYGVSPGVIYEEVYESFSEDRFRLYMQVIGSIELHGDIAVSVVTRKMLDETSTTADDTENFVSFPRLMREVKISALVRELNSGGCKVSLRSKGAINISEVAEYFGGGGHRNAAGCRINAGVEDAKRLVLEKISEMAKR
jgi:bifunctional oligoribonuclease and PAP phosphatase NrnA